MSALRRIKLGNFSIDDCSSIDDISLNLSTYELSCNNNSLKLGLKEFCIMELFCKSGNAIISKEQIIEKIWGYFSNDKDGQKHRICLCESCYDSWIREFKYAPEIEDVTELL